MAVPHGARFPIAFDDLFPQGAYLMGQAKWIIWVVRATGLRAVDAPASGRSSSAKSDAGKSAA